MLVTELRCPKCQNQNLADSNSPISVDLREEIFRMLEEGKNDQEIIDFLVARYGEFVMYRPPGEENYIDALVLCPVLLLLAGLVILLSVRRRHAGVTATVAALAVDEQARLTKLLERMIVTIRAMFLAKIAPMGKGNDVVNYGAAGITCGQASSFIPC